MISKKIFQANTIIIYKSGGFIQRKLNHLLMKFYLIRFLFKKIDNFNIHKNWL